MTWSERRRILLLLLGVCLVIASLVFLATAWIADDAYITLRTVRNLLEGYGPVYNVGERVQAYTHPLWFLMLAATSAVTREMYVTPLLLNMVLSLAAIALLLLRTETGWALGGAALLLASRSFVDYSSSGLENALSHLLALGFFLALADVLQHPTRRLVLLGFCAGLLILNRMDLGLLVAPGLAAALWHRRKVDRRAFRSAVSALSAGFLPFLIWEMFSLVYYGSLVPNTALAKLQSGIPASALARQGCYFIVNSLQVDPLTIPIIAIALLVALLHRGLWECAFAAGVALYSIYVVRIGGDFMSGRLLSALFVVSVLAIVRTLPALVSGRPRSAIDCGPVALNRFGSVPEVTERRSSWICAKVLLPLPRRGLVSVPLTVVGLVLVCVVLITLTPRPPGFFTREFGLDKIGVVDEHGIADERRHYYPQTGLLNGEPVAEKPGSRGYALAGQAAHRAEAPVLPEGAIGVRGFQAGSRVHIVDVHALSDPLLARLPCVRSDRAPGVAHGGSAIGLPSPREGWRIGHFRRNVPRGYLATLLTKEDQIEDPDIAALYRGVHSITSGPLFATERWVAIRSDIFAKNGKAFARPEYQPIDYSELLAYAPDNPEYLFRRAQALYVRGDFEGAERDAERATALDALYTPALAQLAQIRARAGDFERAIALLERVRSGDSHDVQSRIDLGDLYLQVGSPARSVAAYQEALAMDPAQPAKFYNSLGVAQALAGEDAAARASFARALSLAPTQPEAYDNLAQLELEKGEVAKACSLYAQALTLEPDASILLNAGMAFAEAGRIREAVEVLERAWSADHTDASVAFHLAAALGAAGDRTRALEMLREAAGLGHEGAQRELAVFEARG